MSGFWKDLAYAVRTLRKGPAFALTAIATIALGIGASTAIFSVVNAVLLRPLPYREQDRLVLIWGDLTARNVTDFPMPPGDLYDLRQQGTMFEETGAIVTGRQPLRRESGETELIRTAGVTTNFFRLLGTRVTQGRDFVDNDGTPQPPPPQGAPAPAPGQFQQPPLPTFAILSYEAWQSKFGGDPEIVGRRINFLNGNSAEVVGVLEPGFTVLWPPGAGIEPHPEVFTAMRLDLETGSRINVFLRVVGRLKPGVTLAQAQGQINTLVAELRQRFPIKETAGLRWRVEPMQQDLTADVRPVIMALMGAVIFVLLIACANVANLLLVRASVRERDLAVRAALGGARWALIREVMLESLVIAGAGALLGVGLAYAGIRLLIAIGPDNLPRMEDVGLDPMVLGFTALATLLAAVLFGVVPALRASRIDVNDVLRSGGRNAALMGGRRLSSGVVIAEVALAFVLLIGSGLMVRTFLALLNADPGYDPSGLLTFQLPNLNRQTAEARQAFTNDLKQRLETLPGVQSVTAASPLPLDGDESNARWGTEAAAADPSLFQQANVHLVQPGYFETMKTRLVEGRVFNPADNVENLRVVVIDEVLARKAFPGRSAVGERLLLRLAGPEPDMWEIIGVVEHQRHQTLAAEGREAVFVTDGFSGFGNTATWVIRTGGDPQALAQAARSTVQELDRSLPIADMQPMQTYVDQARAPARFSLILIGVFAVIAVVLAAVGLYGVLATLVRQRTAEIGVRMAFGAPSKSILGLVVSQGIRLSIAGIVVGLAAAIGLTRLMSSMLVDVKPTDPVTFAAVSLLFLAIAVIACLIPARRASRLDPNAALRAE